MWRSVGHLGIIIAKQKEHVLIIMCTGHVEVVVDRRDEELRLLLDDAAAVSAVDERRRVLGLLVCAHSAELLDVLGDGVHTEVVLQKHHEPTKCSQRMSEWTKVMLLLLPTLLYSR